MKIKENLHDEYVDHVNLNRSDAYSKCIVDYAEAWANAMEVRMAAGEKLEDIAEAVSTEVDRLPGFGITGAMYGYAASILARYWEHGEDLRRWHNAQYGVVSETGVVNPAILGVNHGVPEVEA